MDSQPIDPTDSAQTPSRFAGLAWLTLGLPMILLVMAAVGYDYRKASAAAAEESTYLMQAESLWQDHDLRYSRLDFDRHLLSRYGTPTDLRLATGSGGREITYDQPFPYALWITPFLILRPSTGFALANVLLLGIVLFWAARRLQPTLGTWSPVLIALLVFGSSIFAHAFFATADLFLFCLTLIACVLIRESSERPGSVSTRDAVIAGALLAIPVLTSPWHLPILLAVALALPKTDRSGLAMAGGLGCFLGALSIVMVQWWSGGGLRIFGTSRFRFTPETGFPAVEFAENQWRASVAELSALHWQGALKLSWGFDLDLWLWNVLHLIAGQSFGILPYFLPLVLLPLLASGPAPGRRSWWVALFCWALGLLIFRPFDLSGGEAVIANRLLLPMAATSVLAWGRPEASRRNASRLKPALALVIPLLAAPFLWRLWSQPGAHPVVEGESYSYPTAVSKALLPYELSQRTMPGGPVLDHLDLRVRLMDRGLGEDVVDLFSFAGDRPAKLWLASPAPLQWIHLAMDENAPSQLELAGAQIRERMLLSDGGISFRLEPELYRKHNLWWSPRTQWVYRLGFRLPEPTDRRIRFRLVGEPADIPDKEPIPHE